LGRSKRETEICVNFAEGLAVESDGFELIHLGAGVWSFECKVNREVSTMPYERNMELESTNLNLKNRSTMRWEAPEIPSIPNETLVNHGVIENHPYKFSTSTISRSQDPIKRYNSRRVVSYNAHRYKVVNSGSVGGGYRPHTKCPSIE
jgi:hypothetical protein